MKRFLALFLGMVGVLLILFLVRLTHLSEPAQPKQARITVQTPPMASPNSVPSHLQNRRGTVAFPDERLKSWGLSAPPEAAPFLYRAVRCAEVAEIEKRRFQPDGNGYRLIGALQRKLFHDDFAYAALASSQLDISLAEYAFGKVAERLQNQESISLPQAESDAMPKLDKKAAEAFSNHYQSFFTSPNTGYSNVFNALSDSSSADVLVSDLLKDGCAYVALRTQANQWRTDEAQDDRATLQEYITHISDPERLARATNSLLEIMQEQENEWDQLQSAYRNIFAFRFRDRHGLDSEKLVPQLDKLELRNAGPELKIPE